MDQEFKALIKAELADFEKIEERLLTPDQQYKKKSLVKNYSWYWDNAACWLVMATPNFISCGSAEALIHYAGLAPMEWSSGTLIRGRPRAGHSDYALYKPLTANLWSNSSSKT